MSDPGSEAATPQTGSGPQSPRGPGLAPEETLRMLESDLPRLPQGTSLAPEGCLLALAADVRCLALADLLGLVHSAGKSGLLCFSSGDHLKSIYLHRGEVVFATSNQRVDRIGESLLRAGAVTLEQLREAERRFTPPERFGKVLVACGFLTPRELWHGVKHQVEEVVRSLFSYTVGTVCFWEGEVQPDNVVRLSLPTRRLVAEGIQRRDELQKFLAMLEDPEVRLAAVAGMERDLNGRDRALLEALAEERAFPDLAKELGLDRLSAARTIQLLRLVGAVKLVRAREDKGFLGEGDLRLHDEDAIRERVGHHLKLMSELSAPVIAVEGAEPLRQRFGRILDEAAQRFPALLGGLELGRHATLDPDRITERALELGKDAEGQVAAALGELVAYLEFELKNHPAVPDPDDFLASLEDLRAKLA